MEKLIVDVRFALRSLKRRPGFSAVVVLTLAVGIGVNVAFVAYLAYFLWPTIEAPDPARIVALHTATEFEPAGANSYPDLVDLRSGTDAFAPLAAYQLFGSALASGEQTLHAWGKAVSGEYFELFGEKAQVGRLIEPADDLAGAERVLVLNHFYWRRHFASDPGIVGQVVELDGRRRYRVVGIAREGFQGDGLAASIYVPLANAQGLLRGLDDRASRRLSALGRLRPGVSLPAARAAIAAFGRGLDQDHPQSDARQFSLAPVTEPNADLLAEPMVVAAKGLMVAVMLLLLLACANVANLMLASAASRRREMGIHAALGVGRLRLGRRLLLETSLLSGLGGLLGLALARALTGLIERYLLGGTPVGMGDFSAGSSLVVDPWRLGLFFVAACVGISLLVGLAPLAHILRSDLVAALKSDAGGDQPGRGFPLRKLLVVAQVALSVVLLVGAGLLVQTLRQVRGLDPGFETAGLMLATIHLPVERARESQQDQQLYRQLVDSVHRLPGVRAAALVQRVPLSGAGSTEAVRFPHSSQAASVNANVVSSGYFRALGLELLAGRDFATGDRPGGPGVVVLNRAAAAKYFPSRQAVAAVGERLELQVGSPEKYESYQVIGVAPDSRYEHLTKPVEPLLYFSLAQRFRQRMTLVVRAEGPLTRPLTELLRGNYPDLAIVDLQPFAEQLRRTTADQKMNADLAAGFGALGLGLAGLGIFSVMSYTVSRRGREIGIRMAVGASRRDVRRWVLGGAARLVATGLAAGLAAGWALALLLESLLYGVDARDPGTFLAVVVVLGAVAFVAALIPALRAARIQPLRALREE